MRDNDRQDTEAMTGNERLLHFGLLEAFGEAIRSKDEVLAVSIMEQAKFTREQASFTVAAILEDPGRYGY